MTHSTFPVAATLIALASFATADARTWRDATGRFSIDAEFVAASAESIVLQKSADGNFVVIPLAKLSRSDQRAARELAAVPPTVAPAEASGEGGTGALNVHADGLTPTQKQLFQEHWLSQVTLEIQPLKSPDISKVFVGNIFEVITTKDLGDGSSSEETQRVVFDGKQFASVAQPSTDEDFPFLKNLVKSDFLLRTQMEAKQFEAALDALYDDGGFGEQAKEIKKQGNKWVFIRGKFFKNFRGYVVSTGADGRITKIAYSLKIR